MTSTTRMMALAMAGLLGGAIPAPGLMSGKALPNVIEPRVRVSKRQLMRAASYGVIRWGYQTGPGWTVAQVKRMAKKDKNRRRHRIACRGRT